MQIEKYPRTPHVEGSRLQPGDEDLDAVPFATLRARHLVVEEKIDGANAAVSFSEEGVLRLQSRGHFLTGGRREKHFAMLKTWATTYARPLHERLGARYVMYGEWCFAKHTIFYDALPHYFLEFDVLDRRTGVFLSTRARHALLAGLEVAHVPVVGEGTFRSLDALVALVRPSLFKTPSWREHLRAAASALGVDVERVVRETDPSDESEGLYLKWEEDGVVRGRYKYIRASFLTSVVDSGSHWLSRPIVPNRLANGATPFGAAP